MRARSLGMGLMLGAIALAGCGSSHRPATAASTPSAAATSTVSTPAGAPPPPKVPPTLVSGFAGRVLKTGDLAGFAAQAPPNGRLVGGTSAASWVQAVEAQAPAAEQTNRIALLKRLGFIAGAQERLEPTSGGRAEAISIVEHFASASDAKAELRAELAGQNRSGLTVYTVASIPGAEGLATSPGGPFTGLNVAFTRGSYYYLVGAGFPAGTSPAAATRASVAAAAQRLYARVP